MFSRNRNNNAGNRFFNYLCFFNGIDIFIFNSKRERRTTEEFIYTSAELFDKINIVQNKQPFTFSKGTQAEVSELAAFLYKINFLVARKKCDGQEAIDRRYFEDHKYLSNRFVDFGYQWEVHPAFRWALYPEAATDIFDSLSIDAEI